MNTTTALLAATVLIVAGAAIATAKGKGRPKGKGEAPRRKNLLTPREQAMHNRLMQSLPELIVLAQVSFGALLTARSYATRNSFDRKMADFVICDRAFQVLAVIELDDHSHNGKESKDASRDAMLRQAGYHVLRYPHIPDIDKVRADFAAIHSPSR